MQYDYHILFTELILIKTFKRWGKNEFQRYKAIHESPSIFAMLRKDYFQWIHNNASNAISLIQQKSIYFIDIDIKEILFSFQLISRRLLFNTSFVINHQLISFSEISFHTFPLTLVALKFRSIVCDLWNYQARSYENHNAWINYCWSQIEIKFAYIKFDLNWFYLQELDQISSIQ